MVVGKRCSSNAPVVACLGSAKKQPFPLAGLPALLEHLAVDLRFIAAFNDQGQAACGQCRLHGFSHSGDVGKVPLPGTVQVQPDEIRLVRGVCSFCPFGKVVDEIPAVVLVRSGTRTGDSHRLQTR